MSACTDISGAGRNLSASCYRPALVSVVAPGIPSWDTAALEAAAAAREAEGREVQVAYDLLVGADGADSLVREAMLTAKPRPVRDFTVQTDLGPRHLQGVQWPGHAGRESDGGGVGPWV